MNATSPQENSRDLLHAASGFPDSDAKVQLLERAVRLADAENDIETALDARLALVYAAAMTSHTDKRIVAYLWCLSLYEREPQRFQDATRSLSLLWWFKGLSSAMVQFPRITLHEIEETHRRMQRVYEERGIGNRPLWASKLNVAIQLGDREEMRRCFRGWADSESSTLSDCNACDSLREVELRVALGEEGRAIEMAEPLLTGRLICSDRTVPTTIGETLRAMVQAGREDEAAKWHSHGHRLLRQPKANLYVAAAHLAYLAHSDDRSRGLGVLERFLERALDPPSPDQQLRFYFAARSLLRRMSATGRRRKMRLPTSLPLYQESGSYRPAELADWFDAQCRRLCDDFDRRNGSDYVSRELPKMYDY
jgi:hypothetical protein